MSAYAEVKTLMSNGLTDDPIFDEYGAELQWNDAYIHLIILTLITHNTADRMPKMTTDSNAGALDAGLECVLVFADLAPLSCIRPQAHAICTGIVEKALGANKASSVQKYVFMENIECCKLSVPFV